MKKIFKLGYIIIDYKQDTNRPDFFCYLMVGLVDVEC